MGKIILNDIEYGGVVDDTKLVKKDSIVTTLDDTVTDEEIPSAKAVHTAIQNVSVGVPTDVYSKTEVDGLLADKADSTDIVDAYTKDETNDLLDAKVNVADLVDAYSKTEVDGLLNAKVNTSDVVTALSSSSTDEEIPSAKTVFDAIQNVSAGVPADVYSKTEVDNLLGNKANTADLVDAYSKTEVDTLLDDKANVDDIIDAYTKEEVDNLLDSKVDTDDLVDSYSKDEVDGLLANKADSSAIIDSYTKEEVNTLLDGKVSTDDVIDAYTKTEVDNLLNAKADTDDLVDAYTKTEVNNLLANKADSSAIIDAYTKTEVNDLLDDKANVDDIIDAYTKTEVDGLLNAKVDSANIVTTLSSSSTDAQIPSAKTVFDAIESVSAGVPADVYSKTDVDNLLANKADTSAIIDAYTKTEVNDLLDDKANTADLIDAYSKTEVNNLLATKADTDDLVDAYTKTEVDGLLGNKANVNDVYSKTDVDDLLADKADSADIIDAYSKEEVNNLLNTKADSSAIVDSYTKTEVDGLLADKVDTDDLVDSYSKTEVDGLLANKANTSAIIDAYSKTEVDTLLTGKADSDDLNNIYTKEEVDNLLDSKADSGSAVDAYTKTEVDDLLANKANTTALDGKIDKTSIVTSVSSISTDTEVPSAKFIYNELDYLSDQTAMTLDNVNLANRKIDETQMDIFDNVKPSIATNTANIATNTARIDNIPNPNILINGGFQINEYNVSMIPSSNSAVYYVTNRWATSNGGLSCIVDTVPTAEQGQFNSNKMLKVQATRNCTGLSVFQIIENAEELYDGKTLTLSFWIKARNSAGKNVTARIGSGGGNTGETRVTLTDSWQYVTSTRTGSYFGSKSDGGVLIFSYDITDFGAGFDIACVKLEVGDKATPFVDREYTEELLLCQRYYVRWNGNNSNVTPLANFSAVTQELVYPILYLPTQMRTTPTLPSDRSNLELYGCNTAQTSYEAYASSGWSVYSMTNNVITLRCFVDGDFAVGSAGTFQLKKGSQYDFALDAELYS